MTGHVPCFQAAMAASFRSAARRAGVHIVHKNGSPIYNVMRCDENSSWVHKLY
jgi:hypothetical protein